MLESFYQTRHLRAKLILGLVLLLVACAPTSPTPNQLTSIDSVGEIIVRYPDDWTDYPEVSTVTDRQGVTLVRAEQPAVQAGIDLTTLPVIRLSYDRRIDTPLKDNLPLTEYAIRLISEQLPNVTFDQPQTRQINSRAAVAFQGVDSASNLNYLYTVVDYISEGGVLVAVLTTPGNLSTSTSAYDLTLGNTRLTIRSVPPTVTPLPESTADLPATGEATSEAEVTIPVAPESSAEAQPILINPESTADLTPEAQPTSEATAEGTVEITASGNQSGTITLGRGVTLRAPEDWTASSNNQTNVTLTDGQQTADALLLDQTLPAGEGLISIEIGTLEEVFRQPFNGFNLERWLTNELGSIVTQGGAAAQSTDIQTIVLDEEVLGLGALVTTPQYDRYIIVGQLGNSLYKRVQLYTTPGEFADYEPVLLQIADSIQLAQN